MRPADRNRARRSLQRKDTSAVNCLATLASTAADSERSVSVFRIGLDRVMRRVAGVHRSGAAALPIPIADLAAVVRAVVVVAVLTQRTSAASGDQSKQCDQTKAFHREHLPVRTRAQETACRGRGRPANRVVLSWLSARQALPRETMWQDLPIMPLILRAAPPVLPPQFSRPSAATTSVR